MAYTKTVWSNNNEPALNADNLNHIEQGIYDAHDSLSGKVDKVQGKGLSQNDFTDTLKGKLDGIDMSSKLNKANVAEDYSSSSTYALGEYCLKDGALYKCTTAITTAEAWNAAHWTATEIGEEITDLKDSLVVDSILSTTSENPVQNKVITRALDEKVYGFHIDSSESDPSDCVTYLADATGFTPAHMDFVNDQFIWGSWKNAFFLPRPCMLKYDGTVDYYLDPDDYTKKEDGTASDVADDTYGGNAMMEWGQNGKKIWYKIVPDANDNTSASVYIADHSVDSGYHAWPFINNQGVLVDHFYTPIYNGTIDGNGKLRSISGKGYSALCQSKTPQQEMTAARLNNPGSDILWNTEVYCDIILIDLLLILMGKSTGCQAVFGTGRCGQSNTPSSMLGTGTMDNKGLFYGTSASTGGVKVFGMENWWGNRTARYAGHALINNVHKYKMTFGRQDGSSVDGFVISNSPSDYSGYKTGATVKGTTGSYIKKMQFDENCFDLRETGGTDTTYWEDFTWFAYGCKCAMRGGHAAETAAHIGPFFAVLSIDSTATATAWDTGASPSCKPSYTP